MNVGELKALLDTFDPALPVVIKEDGTCIQLVKVVRERIVNGQDGPTMKIEGQLGVALKIGWDEE
jgi:hypothetical protein